MKAEELRIGNKITANGLHGGKIMTVEQIGTQGTLLPNRRVINFKEHEVGEFISDCFGIPLTSEWLTRAGFKQGDNVTANDSFYEIAVGGSSFGINPDNGVVWITSIGGTIFNNPALIETVHALQNLYFCLTGSELEFKQ